MGYRFVREGAESITTVEIPGEHVDAYELALLFKDFMLGCGFHPNTVKEVFNEEEDEMPLASRSNRKSSAT